MEQNNKGFEYKNPDQPEPLRPANLCVLVIFGISGDLTKRLLYPAICNLGSRGLLNEKFCIVGVAVEPYTTETFRTQLIKNVNEFVEDPAAKEYGISLANRIYYCKGEFSDQKVYLELKAKLSELETTIGNKNVLFYFAAPPEFMSTIAKNLNDAQLLSEEKDSYFRRIVVEKPFGHDFDSAKKLNQELLSEVNEQQIFRIDHFLGKETVQNLLAFRFSNGIFEPIWNRRYIDHVQITVAETLGVELRGAYYEHAGALRDMVPNHLFQVLSLITMEPPVAFTANYIRDEKAKALHAIQVLTPEQVFLQAIRGQYGPGRINDTSVVGYRSEKNVSPQSSTETFVALKLFLDNWRWLQVPFYVRTGKCLKAHTSEIIIQFRPGPSTLFGGSGKNIMPNLLRINIQPEEGISLRFNAKKPGADLRLGQVDMKFRYSDYFGMKPQTGYETILYDCMNGDHTLFNNAEMVETSWAVIQSVLDVWSTIAPHDFPNYSAGTWGPSSADELLKKDGRTWLL